MIVISKDKAVFWMDGDGRWHNRHGVFGHQKIIDHFNAAIQKDVDGYYLLQDLGHVVEKVYFPYEETALFVVDVILDDPFMLVLNTGTEAAMRPENLFIRSDSLYYRIGEEIAKFNQRALMAISEGICQSEQGYQLTLGDGARTMIEQIPS